MDAVAGAKGTAAAKKLDSALGELHIRLGTTVEGVTIENPEAYKKTYEEILRLKKKWNQLELHLRWQIKNHFYRK